jgi:hypothetical protein
MKMATKTNRRESRQGDITDQAAEQAREITRDVAEYLTEYARENPGYAALICLGVGFVLGWKLKPW